MPVRPAIASSLALLATLVVVPIASAAFPGPNGPIAFARETPETTEIYTMSPDGSMQRSVTPGANGRTPSFSPDGKLIAFERELDIWVMNADGTNARNLINDPVGTKPDLDPAFSLDGTRIIFARDANSNGLTDEVFSVGVDGKGLTNITQNGVDLEDDPSFSPDGTKIAWVRDTGGSFVPDEIWTMNANGSNQTQLTQFGDFVSIRSPDYSPDGSRIAFSRDGDIWVIDAGGGVPENLTMSPTVGEIGPAFSPDGTQIAISRNTDADPIVDEIFSLGTEDTNLTNTPDASEYEPSWGTDMTAPETTLTKKPKRRVEKSKARFGFESSEPGSTFECKLDKRDWRPCSSPRKVKRLKPKRHRFRVRATDIAGNTDLTPAKHRWRVLD